MNKLNFQEIWICSRYLILIWNNNHGLEKKTLMICGVCKLAIPSYRIREHLAEFHKIDCHLVEWIIKTDDKLISLKLKIKHRLWLH